MYTLVFRISQTFFHQPSLWKSCAACTWPHIGLFIPCNLPPPPPPQITITYIRTNNLICGHQNYSSVSGNTYICSDFWYICFIITLICTVPASSSLRRYTIIKRVFRSGTRLVVPTAAVPNFFELDVRTNPKFYPLEQVRISGLF